MEKLYWGLDIGGTKCALVTGTRDCRVLSRHAVPTRDFSSWQEVLEALLAHKTRLSAQELCEAVVAAVSDPKGRPDDVTAACLELRPIVRAV